MLIIVQLRKRGYEDFVKRMRKSIIFIFLNLLFLIALFGAFLIYTIHLEFMPWYQANMMGFQFLGLVFFVFPAFLATGIGMLILGRSFPVSHLGRVLPFIMIAALWMPFLLVRVPHSDIVMPIFATLIIVASTVLVITVLLKTLVHRTQQ